ncbi:MAG: hypothetical protein A2Y62_02630 [Candidatus Fischerbacteria bacterium RBG_13_37_8]|uniref:Calcineurin-like phosphoesterase domain-containing protein n=1 Tax=Candidatus Fischerbacteria bacterium RBG_13_37_8 TaxID=1817863 RepID=A0A1F5VS12_9BACT|nr:MAG: hypothetical protein A2Y62_02630 [Candidatus Fischerbacteria bacterium RBG_13_37_8]
MIIFLIVFLSLYGGIHAYLFFKAKAALDFSMRTSIILALFMLIMLVTPILLRLIERTGNISLARPFANIGFTWMGFLFLFLMTSLVFDIYKLLITIADYILHKSLSAFFPNITYIFLISVFIPFAIIIYGFFEAANIRVEQVIIKTAKLPAEIKELRIVQITDLHLSLTVNEKYLQKVMMLVKESKPDIFISTGDLIDDDTKNLDRLAALLNGVEAQYGKFAVTGNHEFYFGLPRATAFHEKAGFTILRQQSVDIEGILMLTGVDDPTAHQFDPNVDVSALPLLKTIPHERFTILLKHQPRVERGAAGLFDLQLSGHTHKGQIFPFMLFTKIFFPLTGGYLHKIDGSLAYVSRGTGTWGPPIRFLAPPEITVFDIVRKK